MQRLKASVAPAYVLGRRLGSRQHWEAYPESGHLVPVALVGVTEGCQKGLQE